MGVFQDYKDDFILLVESGFIAVNQSDEDAATKLFHAAALLQPGSSLSQLGLGYIQLCKLNLAGAAQLFSDVVTKEPANDVAKTLLGLSYALNPAEVIKGEKVLTESATNSKDPLAKNLATSALDFIDRFIKKDLSPAQVAPQLKKDRSK
jgi:hypothetical protein